jgi:hypothetical protein
MFSSHRFLRKTLSNKALGGSCFLMWVCRYIIMRTNSEAAINLKLILLFIPVAYVSFLFHEFGHWIVGEVFGNDMAYSLNGVWPKRGAYLDESHALYVLIGGPAFTIMQSMFFFLIIERYRTLYAYPFVFFPLFTRFFSLALGGFNEQDEAKISAILDLGTYTVAVIVVLILFLLVWRSSYKLKMSLKSNAYLCVISTLCELLVIETHKMML